MKPRRRLAPQYAIVFLVIALLGVLVNVGLAVYQSDRPPMATLSPTFGGVLVTGKLAVLLAGPLSLLLFAIHSASTLARRTWRRGGDGTRSSAPTADKR